MRCILDLSMFRSNHAISRNVECSLTISPCELKISCNKNISMENRFDRGSFLGRCMSADPTDVPICEPSPFRSRPLPYKLNQAGLCYDVGVSLHAGHIVWIIGLIRVGKLTCV